MVPRSRALTPRPSRFHHLSARRLGRNRTSDRVVPLLGIEPSPPHFQRGASTRLACAACLRAVYLSTARLRSAIQFSGGSGLWNRTRNGRVRAGRDTSFTSPDQWERVESNHRCPKATRLQRARRPSSNAPEKQRGRRGFPGALEVSVSSTGLLEGLRAILGVDVPHVPARRVAVRLHLGRGPHVSFEHTITIRRRQVFCSLVWSAGVEPA